MAIEIETNKLCSYGCGQIAKYKFKNGKLCCSDNISKCSVYRKKVSINKKATLIKTTELCSYGCGQIAKYKFKNGKLCCKNHYNKCPINSKKIKKGKRSIPIETTELCSYGCGQIAKYKFGNGKLCCSKYFSKCPINGKKISDGQKSILIETTELCSFGCGQVAKYKLKNGKLCCSKNIVKCPINRGKLKLTIDQIKEKYPTFANEEEMRYNPDKPNEKEIQVRCKYNGCENSKEKNRWFTPTYNQMRERIYCLEKDWGNGGGYLYCSNKCKEKCILFNLRSDPFKDIIKPYTQQEYNIWKQENFKRQFDRDGYNHCEMCDSTENLQVHHEHPQKTHPLETLDPDNGIILCRDCHYKIGHKSGTDCSTGNLANYNPC